MPAAVGLPRNHRAASANAGRALIIGIHEGGRPGCGDDEPVGGVKIRRRNEQFDWLVRRRAALTASDEESIPSVLPVAPTASATTRLR
jgi:hypothetical protein